MTGTNPGTVRPLQWATPPATALVVTARWESGGETDAVVRALAGVLARHRQVEVLALVGPGGPPRHDGAVTVTDLTVDQPEATTAVLVGATLESVAAQRKRPSGWLPEPAATALAAPTRAAWAHVAAAVATHHPTVVVLVGDLGPEAVELVASLDPAVVSVALPLSDHRRPPTAAMVTLLQTVRAVAATSPADAAWWRRYGVDPVDIGAHLPANPYAIREPPAMLLDDGYVAVVDAVDAVGDSALAHDRPGGGHGPAVAVAGWLAGALHPFAVVAVDGADIITWDRGRAHAHTVVTSRSDLWRVLAFARAVAVVEPGPHLARSALEAMLHGTAVLAPAGTLAAAHVAEADGGLVVADDPELLAAVTALAGDPDAAAVLGRAAQEWALPRFGDRGEFSKRVAAVCGLDTSR